MILNQSAPSRPRSGVGAGVPCAGVDARERHVGDLHLVAALASKPIADFTSAVDLLHFLRRCAACRLAVVAVDAVDHHRDRQLLHVAAVRPCWL